MIKKSVSLKVFPFFVLMIFGIIAGATEKNFLPGTWRMKHNNPLIDDKGIITCVNTSTVQMSGVTQNADIRQREPKPLRFSAESKSENAQGSSFSNYFMLITINFEDGKSEQVLASFQGGTHDWQKIERIYKPSKPIRSIMFQLLFRAMTGKVYFRNASVTEESAELVSEAVEKKVTENIAPNYATDSEWAKAATGKNLALGKKVTFSSKPTYWLTARGETDTLDLTDGKLATNSRIWFSSESVGWEPYNGFPGDDGIRIKLDLGKIEKVGNAAIRFLAGGAQYVLLAPKKVEIYVSKDDWQYYPAGSLEKLAPDAKNYDHKLFCVLPYEDGKAYCHTFVFDVNAEVRYIIFRAVADVNMLFTDELAVIESTTEAADFNNVYSRAPMEFQKSGIRVTHRLGELAIPLNLPAPNAFRIYDMRTTKNKEEKALLVLELPEAVEFDSKDASCEKMTIGGIKYNRYTVPLVVRGREHLRFMSQQFMFRLKEKLPSEAKARLYVTCADEPVVVSELPIRPITIPEVEEIPHHTSVSIGWMYYHQLKSYPDFSDNWKKIGFNTVPFFMNDPKSLEDRDFIDLLREKNYMLMLNCSPFVLVPDVGDGEFRCVSANGTKFGQFCLSYMGKYYQNELDKVRQSVAILRPDCTMADIECWNGGAQDKTMGCLRCGATEKASGLPKKEYFSDCGTRIAKDIHDAVAKGFGDGREHEIQLYWIHSGQTFVKQDIFDWKKLYPNYITGSMEVFYCAGAPFIVHNELVKDYDALPERKNFVWLTPGSYGQYAPEKVEFIVYEVLLNGASGMAYFEYYDVDTPRFFQYHAKAMKTMRPYLDFLCSGKCYRIKGSNPGHYYSAVRKENEMILLVGNYRNYSEKTAIELDFKPAKITDLLNGGTIPVASKLEIDVPRGGIRLLYIK